MRGGRIRCRVRALAWMSAALVLAVAHGQDTGTGTAGAAGASGAAGTAAPSGNPQVAALRPLVKTSAADCKANGGSAAFFSVPMLACTKCGAGQVPNDEGNDCVCPATSRSAGLRGPLVCIDCEKQNLDVTLDGMSCTVSIFKSALYIGLHISICTRAD